MTVQAIMRTDIVALSLRETFGSAFRIMTGRRIRSLPVVDGDNIYLGMFDLYDVWKVLLPRAAVLDGRSVPDLAFLSGSQDHLLEKFNEAANRPISEFLNDERTAIVHPETPVEEAMLHLYRKGGNLPVVERKSRKLVGIVSAWEILNLIR